MKQEFEFLPGFDKEHLLAYYSNDLEAIKEMFMITNLTLEDDLHKVINAVNDKDIEALRRAVHAIRPLFYVLGLPELETEIKNFYALTLDSETVDALTKEFMHAWQKLLKGQNMINEQYKLLESMPAVTQ